MKKCFFDAKLRFALLPPFSYVNTEPKRSEANKKTKLKALSEASCHTVENLVLWREASLRAFNPVSQVRRLSYQMPTEKKTIRETKFAFHGHTFRQKCKLTRHNWDTKGFFGSTFTQENGGKSAKLSFASKNLNFAFFTFASQNPIFVCITFY